MLMTVNVNGTIIDDVAKLTIRGLCNIKLLKNNTLEVNVHNIAGKLDIQPGYNKTRKHISVFAPYTPSNY